ncbi:MAG: MgtC/SapB family protein [Cyanobacteria bacterium P01_D01_bin.44]
MDWTIMTRLAIALALGLIIGAERGWQVRKSSEERVAAGIRSFGFMGLLGGLGALLALEWGSGLLGVIFLGFALTVTVSYWVTSQQTQDFGLTTELAMLLTFGLGALVVSGYEAEGVAIAVIVTTLLSFKQELHWSLEQINRQELLATLQLLLIAMVALPLLPNQSMGPWQAINPRTVGLLVMLIATISYVGYFAVRLLGERVGLLVTAILGGLVSSTAVTVAFSRRAKLGEGNLTALGAGIALASGTMAVRLLLEVAVVNPSLLRLLIPPMACLAIVPLLAAVVIGRLHPAAAAQAPVSLKNPIDLKSALTYSLLLTVLFVLVRATEAWLGGAGIYLLSAISGIADVDAVSLSLAESANTGLSDAIATFGILIAVAVNTLTKATIVALIGGWKLARWCATILLTALGLGLTVTVLTHLAVVVV